MDNLDDQFGKSVIDSQTITTMKEICDEQISQKDKEIALVKEQLSNITRLNHLLNGVIEGQEKVIIALKNALSEATR